MERSGAEPVGGAVVLHVWVSKWRAGEAAIVAAKIMMFLSMM